MMAGRGWVEVGKQVGGMEISMIVWTIKKKKTNQKNVIVALLWLKRFDVINLPPGWSSQEGVVYRSLSISLLCTSKALSSSRSSLCISLRLRLHPCCHGHFALKQAAGWLGTEANRHSQNVSSCHLIIESFLYSGCLLVIFTWDTNAFTLIHSESHYSKVVQLIKICICCLDKIPSILISQME